MPQSASHITDQQLLLYIDGELSSRDALQLSAHLAECPQCRSRMAAIQRTIAEVGHAHHRSSELVMDASGPRALLKARLAESADAAKRSSWMHPRLARNLAYLCALLMLIAGGVRVLQQIAGARHSSYAGLLPNPVFTPGSTRPVALSDLCATEDDEVVRSVPGSVQRKVFLEYGIHDAPTANFEVDYLITPGLGGSDNVRNLWPEPHSSTWNSYVKDQLEERLHRMVCEHSISLSEAQRDIATNWISAYKKYFHTQQPIENPSQAALSGRLQLAVALRRKQRLS